LQGSAAQCAPGCGCAIWRRVLRAAFGHGRDPGYDNHDYQQGLNAFRAKRKPQFTGQ